MIDSSRVFVDDAGQVLVNPHTADQCIGVCPMHRPSDHHMRDWPLVYRADRRIFERICPHGGGHPDPDSLQRKVEYFEELGREAHTCDGCCVPEETK